MPRMVGVGRHWAQAPVGGADGFNGGGCPHSEEGGGSFNINGRESAVMPTSASGPSGVPAKLVGEGRRSGGFFPTAIQATVINWDMRLTCIFMPSFAANVRSAAVAAIAPKQAQLTIGFALHAAAKVKLRAWPLHANTRVRWWWMFMQGNAPQQELRC